MDNEIKESIQTEKFHRIRRTILTRVLFAPFLIVMLVFGLLVYFFADTLKQRTEVELIASAEGHRALIEKFLSEQASVLEFAASVHSFDELSNDENLADLYLHLERQSAAFVDLGVFDEGGRHVAYVGPYDLEGRDYSREEWFSTVREKGIYISDVFLGYRKVPHFVVAVQRQEAGRRWYLRATVDSRYFSELVKGLRGGEAYLVNRAGFFQAERRSGGTLNEKDPDIGLYETAGEQITSFTARGADGVRYLYVAGRLRETGWILAARQDLKQAYAPLARPIAAVLIVIALGGGVVVLTAYVLASAQAGRLALADAEKREMKHKLLVAGKLAEVGEMSAGMAHEINNPLQVMISECAMINELLYDVDPPGRGIDADTLYQVRDCVNQINLQIDRCRGITQGLLKFARKTDASISEVALGDLVREVAGMVEHRAHVDGIALLVDISDGIPPVLSDPAQLQQVFLNLVNNAMYAVRGSEHPEIRVTVAPRDEKVAVSVADNGCGIEPENLEKVFLPFYTTKPVGQGTGLGLSTCYGIVERLGGRIMVESELNTGTVFTVLLSQAVGVAGA